MTLIHSLVGASDILVVIFSWWKGLAQALITQHMSTIFVHLYICFECCFVAYCLVPLTCETVVILFSEYESDLKQ